MSIKLKAKASPPELDFGYAASNFAFALTILIILQVKYKILY